MRLYVNRCENCNQKIYLNIAAYSRSQIRQQFNSDTIYVICNHCNYKGIYGLNEIYAEVSSNSSVSVGIIGGLLGLVGGPLGMALGGGIGALIGASSDEEDRKRVAFFNSSL